MIFQVSYTLFYAPPVWLVLLVDASLVVLWYFTSCSHTVGGPSLVNTSNLIDDNENISQAGCDPKMSNKQ